MNIKILCRCSFFPFLDGLRTYQHPCISFDASLVTYINSTNILPIMITNRIYELKPSVAVACFRPGRAKDLSAPLYYLWTRRVLIN